MKERSILGRIQRSRSVAVEKGKDLPLANSLAEFWKGAGAKREEYTDV